MALTKIDDRGLTTPIDLLDNEKIRFGTGNDLEIYHNGSDSYILNSTGRLLIPGAEIDFMSADQNEWMIKSFQNGAVELYYDNDKKAATLSDGFAISGDSTLYIGAAGDLRLSHDGSNSYIKDVGPGDLRILSSELNIQNAAGTETQAYFAENGAVALYYDGNKKFETTSTGATVTGDFVPEANATRALGSGSLRWAGAHITALRIYTDGQWYDNAKATFGHGEDLQIYHNGSHSYIEDTGTGNLNIQGSNIRINTLSPTENMAIFYENGAVELYYDNSKKLETHTTGVVVHGNISPDNLYLGDNEKAYFGDGSDLQIYHDGNKSWLKNSTGDLMVNTGGTIYLANVANSENKAKFIDNGAVELYYDSAVKIGTTSFGFYSYGHIYPATTQNKDLGSSSYRWDYIYADHALDTSDRNLKNTIQATDLGLSFVNKLNPVSYKLNGKDKTHYGLIAQEVEEVITEEGKTLDDFGAIVHKEEIYSLAYNEFISPLIKAVQELSAEVEALKAK